MNDKADRSESFAGHGSWSKEEVPPNTPKISPLKKKIVYYEALIIKTRFYIAASSVALFVL